MIHEKKIYGDHSVDDVVQHIVNDITRDDESRAWTGERETPGHYQEICTELAKQGIVPLDDLFGSWGRQEQHKPEYEFDVTVKFNITATDEKDALDKWSSGDYDSHEVLDYKKTKSERRDVHITYHFYGDGEGDPTMAGVIKYRATDGSSGSTPNQTEAEFQEYWTDHYKGKKVTYEKI